MGFCVGGLVWGGGGWGVRLCSLRAWIVLKNWLGAVGQSVKQQEKILISAQIEWLARWKVGWWSVWQRCCNSVDFKAEYLQVPDRERGQPVIG